LRILVLGGQGFIGRNLIEELYDKNEVIIVDRYKCKEIELNNCSYFTQDINNVDSWEYLLDNIDVLYHLASSANPLTSTEDILSDIKSNICGTVQILQAAVKKGVKKIVYPSSGGTVYGEAIYSPIDEKHPTNPACTYGIAKLAIEKYVQVFHKMYGIDYCILRFANVYGRYQTSNTQGAINIFMRKLMADEAIEIWGDGSAVRDYINVKDAVDALMLAGMRSSSEKIFNVGSNKGMTVEEIVIKIASCLKKTANIEYKKSRGFDVASNVLDCSLIKNVYGFEPKISLDEGIISMLSSS